MAFPVKIQIDLPVQSIKQDSDGRSHKGWDHERRMTGPDVEFVLTNVWRDPARHTCLLQPAQLTEDFMTSADGLFARLPLASFHKNDGTVSVDWDQYGYRFAEDTFLLAKTLNQRLTTIKKWPYNQAFFLRLFAFGQEWRGDTWFEFEWGLPSVGSTSPQHKLIVAHDASFVLEKAGAEVFRGHLTPGVRDLQRLTQKPLHLMILPYRRNEILFWTDQGAYPVFTDTTLNPLEPNGKTYLDQEGYGSIDPDQEDFKDWVITHYGHAAITFPNSKGRFQLTPLVYLTGPDGTSSIRPTINPKIPYPPDQTLFPPDTSIEMELDADIVSGSAADGAHNIDGDGVDDTADWRINISGDQPLPDTAPTHSSKTPFVYGLSIRVPTALTDKPDETTSITNYITRLARRFSEDGSAAEIIIKDANIIDPSEDIRKAHNRTCRIYREDGAGNEDELFYGVAGEPEFEQWPVGADGLDHTPVTLTIMGMERRLGRTMLKNFRALDGMLIHEAIHAILDRVGWPVDRRDIDESLIRLPSNPKGEEKIILSDQVGNAWDLLNDLRENYTTSSEPPYKWIMDFAPTLGSDVFYTIRFRFKDPLNLPDVSAPAALRTLYATQAEATAAGATKDNWARSYRRKAIEPEANWVIVYGETPDGAPVWGEDFDKDSINPSLEYADRPDNWIGEIREMIYVNLAINTKEHANRIASSLLKRLCRPRYIAEGDLESLYSDRLYDRWKATWDNDRRYSLTDLEVEHILETDGMTVRTARWTGEARE